MKQEKINFAHISRTVLWLGLIVCACLTAARAQPTAFTYQGRFTDASVAQPTNGTYNMQFALYDSGGTQSGATLTNAAVQVTNGVFTVSLDFGANSFDGTARLLEIRVFSATINDYVVLNPRQSLTSSPYSIRTLSAASADGLSNLCVGCVQDANINSVSGAKVTGTVANATTATTATTAGNITGVVPILNGGTGSATKNFVDLTTAQTIAGNKTFSATLTGNVVNATTTVSGNIVNAGTQYNIGGNRVLTTAGTENLFAGIGAGAATSAGAGNAFFGRGAGGGNTTGNLNSFFGYLAGSIAATSENTFFGAAAGRLTTTGDTNSFFGRGAGETNSTGFRNSFFGHATGFSNTTGSINAFFGSGAGFNNTQGSENTFLGRNAGETNTTGNNNTFVGKSAGQSNATGSNNTIVGYLADFGANNLTFATAVGAGALVSNNNSVVLGRAADTVQIPGNLVVAGTISGTVGQSATTVSGTGSLVVTNATTVYTLVPGLTQTVTVPANSSLLISTDGGIQSSGAVNTFSVVDVAVFIDGSAAGIRRIVISNFPLPGSVGNWALSLGQTLAAGSHTIEVRALNGFGGSANSNVSSGSDPLLRGQLTVAVIKK